MDKDGKQPRPDDRPATVILFMDFEKLQAMVAKLRTELARVVLERDELLYVECRNIEMRYMLAIGGLEYKAYEIECAILRLKRKAELIQTQKNRQEKVVLAQIEALLDSEFAAYQAKLNEQIAKLNAALERNRSEPLSAAETSELKKLYRAIVKSLHPDLHPEQSAAKSQLFQNAVTAYENGDIDGLRLISTLITEPDLPEADPDAIAQLMREKGRLSELIQSVTDRITEIKTAYPYTMKALLQSPAKTRARQTELEARIEQLNETLTAYAAKILEMLR